MAFQYFNRVHDSGAARAFDRNALAWEATVAANGGTPSLNQRATGADVAQAEAACDGGAATFRATTTRGR